MSLVFSRRSYHSLPDSLAGGYARLILLFASLANNKTTRDLDGDKYFVSWDQTLIPKKVEEMQTRVPPPKLETADTLPRDISILKNSLISTFLKMRHLTVIGTIGNEWIKAIEQSEELAYAAYPQLLAKEMEIALVCLTALSL